MDWERAEREEEKGEKKVKSWCDKGNYKGAADICPELPRAPHCTRGLLRTISLTLRAD